MEFEKKVCPDCNGSGIYEEYDEYDRYAIRSCATCDGSGEIARQSVTSEEVAEVIKRFEKRNNKLKEVQDNGDAGCVDIETWEKYQVFIEDNNLAITALQAYHPWIPVSEKITQESEAE